MAQAKKWRRPVNDEKRIQVAIMGATLGGIGLVYHISDLNNLSGIFLVMGLSLMSMLIIMFGPTDQAIARWRGGS